MDDLSEKLSALLSDPEGMEKIKSMAEGLLGSSTPKEPNPFEDMGEIDVGAIARVMGMMKQNRMDDSRIKLLIALKPNLSPERQGRVDSAVKILKLIEIAPLLKESGLLNF